MLRDELKLRAFHVPDYLYHNKFLPFYTEYNEEYSELIVKHNEIFYPISTLIDEKNWIIDKYIGKGIYVNDILEYEISGVIILVEAEDEIVMIDQHGHSGFYYPSYHLKNKVIGNLFTYESIESLSDGQKEYLENYFNRKMVKYR